MVAEGQSLRTFLEPALELVEDVGADVYRRRYLDGARGTLRRYGFYRLAVAKVHGESYRLASHEIARGP